jgi:hypothetical protein
VDRQLDPRLLLVVTLNHRHFFDLHIVLPHEAVHGVDERLEARVVDVELAPGGSPFMNGGP